MNKQQSDIINLLLKQTTYKDLHLHQINIDGDVMHLTFKYKNTIISKDLSINTGGWDKLTVFDLAWLLADEVNSFMLGYVYSCGWVECNHKVIKRMCYE